MFFDFKIFCDIFPHIAGAGGPGYPAPLPAGRPPGQIFGPRPRWGNRPAGAVPTEARPRAPAHLGYISDFQLTTIFGY